MFRLPHKKKIFLIHIIKNMLPYIEPKVSSSVSDGMPSKMDKRENEDMLVNNLVYRQPVDLSLAKSRTHTKQFFQRSDYTSAAGKTAICDWNTGASYINCSNSFLVFDLEIKSDTPLSYGYNFGRGSAMNVVNRLNIRTKSGSEVDRVDYVPLWSRVDVEYNTDNDYKESMMSLAGYGKFYTTSSQSAVVKNKFAIPLERLAPFFRPLKGQLMPPQMASGLHLEFVFEDILNIVAYASADAVPTTYDITNIHFLLDQVDLSDEAQKAISVESAETGLEWVTPRVYSVQTSLSAGVSNVSVQIRKAVSQATRSYSVIQQTTQYGSKVSDATQSMAFPASVKFQYNLGSLYFPNTEVVDTIADTPVSSFLEALYAFDKTKESHGKTNLTIQDFRATSNVFAMTSSRDDQLYLSGLNVNNSRALQFKGEFVWAAGDTSAHLLTSFLEYVQVVKVYNDQSVVSI
jgi:hypothetical protein